VKVTVDNMHSLFVTSQALIKVLKYLNYSYGFKLLEDKSMLGLEYSKEKHGDTLINPDNMQTFFKERSDLLSFLFYLYHQSLIDFVHNDDPDITYLTLDKRISSSTMCSLSNNNQCQIFLPKQLLPIADCEYQSFMLSDNSISLIGWSCFSKISKMFVISLACSDQVITQLKQSGSIDIGYYDDDLTCHTIQSGGIDVQSADFYHESFKETSSTLSGLEFCSIEKSINIKFSGDINSDIDSLDLTGVSHKQMAQLTIMASALLCAHNEDAASVILKGKDLNDSLVKNFINGE